MQRTLVISLAAFFVLAVVSVLFYRGTSLNSGQPDATTCRVCVAEQAYDRMRENRTGGSYKQLTNALSAEAKLKVSKAVTVSVGDEISTEYGEGVLNQTFREVVLADPTVTQRANLYTAVCCALHENVCRNTELTEAQKQRFYEQTLTEWKGNIEKLIEESYPNILVGAPLPPGPVEQPVTGTSRPDVEQGQTPAPRRSAPTTATTATAVDSKTRQLTDLSHDPVPVEPTSVPEIRAPAYLRSGTDLDITFLASSDTDYATAAAVSRQLGRTGLRTRPSALTAAFTADFGESLDRNDWSFLPSAGLSSQLRCICRVSSDLTTGTKVVFGRDLESVSGPTTLELVLTGSGEVFSQTINTSGAGAAGNPALALETYHENLLKADNFKRLAFHHCR